jgi:hypothetical protein
MKLPLKNHIEKKPDWATLPYTLHDFSQHRSKEKLIFRTLRMDVFFLLFKDGNSYTICDTGNHRKWACCHCH